MKKLFVLLLDRRTAQWQQHDHYQANERFDITSDIFFSVHNFHILLSIIKYLRDRGVFLLELGFERNELLFHRKRMHV